jgi:signal transduction protein with GAF and PtsI domain
MGQGYLGKEGAMENHVMHYETLLRVTNAISQSKDPEEVVLITVESITTALNVKGCSIFLINKKSKALELAASYGLSKDYLNKGPVKHMGSLRRYLEEGPVAIYDVTDDPRIQYPNEAKGEGISSILSVPVFIHGNVEGILRVYTAEPWDFTLRDVNLLQAVAQISGMAIDMCRLYKGYKTSIEILKSMRNKKAVK